MMGWLVVVASAWAIAAALVIAGAWVEIALSLIPLKTRTK